MRAYVVTLDVWYLEFPCEILCDGTLTAAGGARDDPHVPMVRCGKSTVDLLH